MSNDRSMPWFKLFSEARNDAKLRSLTDAEHRVWFQLLCLAAEQEERGTIAGYDEELLAIEACNADVALLRVTLVTLTKLRIVSVDENTITFCAFARRQHTKPSDTPERVKSRVAKHRAKAKQDDVTPVTPPVTPRNAMKRLDVDEEVDRDKEEIVSLSGKVSNKSDDVGMPAAAAGATHEWTQAEAARMARRVAGMLHMKNPNLDGLMAIIRQYPPAQQWLEAQAAGCYEYYSERKQNVSIRLFDNWLKRDEERRRGSASTSSAQQPLVTEKVLGNGHTTPDAKPHDIANDPLYEFNIARARAKLVS